MDRGQTGVGDVGDVTFALAGNQDTLGAGLDGQHLETYFALAHEDDGDGQRVPASVEPEFRRYLQCGILACGFARARCPDCGHDFLVAFSCKGRGLCASCNARRMAETAAHLVDHVIPPLPMAFITEAAPVERILTHIGEPPRPPPITPARPGAAQSCSVWVPPA